ncbi:MAG: carboxypeptidase regulatory-like domain-containing protein [Bacteroidota bacterium]
MKRDLIKFGILFVMVISILNACKKDDPEPTTGFLSGTVYDAATDEALADVRIIIYNSETNSPTDNTITTGSDGTYKVELEPGSYYLNLNKQSYMGIPAAGTTPVSVAVELGLETISDYNMQASPVINGGSITGKVMNGETAVAGALIVAESGNTAFSSVTDADGIYFIYNVPAETYNVKAYMSGFNSDEVSATVSSNTESADNNLNMTEGAIGEVSGLVTFLATDNGIVDVSLTHRITKETIPGLVTTTEAGAYTIANVPNGTYIARASYGNDGYVVDPDWIIKNGEPVVTINDNVVTRAFSVTGAVEVTSPSNEASTTVPVEITETLPVFTWVAYSSTSDYIIEVSDINGNVIWGGFSGAGANLTKNIIIAKDQLSIEFNSDGNAASDLELNTVYRWRIFASKDDVQEVTGWKLISGSEEQRGLFIIK